jgi:two-component system, LytTR family, response regulator
MKISCIAIDDEPLALDIITDYCRKVPFLQLQKTFENAIEAIDYLKNNKVDLIFLDIQMEELTGIQLLNVLKEKPMIIFTTAYESYAVQCFELDALDYLLKPISFERFLKSVDKACEKKKSSNGNVAPSQAVVIENSVNLTKTKNYIFVKTEFRMQKINLCDILYIEGQGDYLCIYTPKERIMTLQNFHHFEENLPSGDFVRVHKSYMVALEKVESVERNRIKIGEKYIPIGETYRKSFFEILEK